MAQISWADKAGASVSLRSKRLADSTIDLPKTNERERMDAKLTPGTQCNRSTRREGRKGAIIWASVREKKRHAALVLTQTTEAIPTEGELTEDTA